MLVRVQLTVWDLQSRAFTLDCSDKHLALSAKLKMTHYHLNAQPLYNDGGLERQFVSNCSTCFIHTPNFTVYGWL